MAEIPIKIRVIIVEDSASDAALIEYELTAWGFAVDATRVEDSKGLREALTKPCDIVISDFRLPQFNAILALEIVRKTVGDIPFILVSQAVGEGIAVEMMRAGANDYVMKSSLTRLGGAVERELKDAVLRRQAREASERIQLALDGAALGLVDVRIEAGERFVDRRFAEILGYTQKEFMAKKLNPMDLIHREDFPVANKKLREHYAGLTGSVAHEHRIQQKSGEWIWVMSRGKVVERSNDGTAVRYMGTLLDISERKAQEAEIAQLSQRLIEISEMERTSIAAELHDSIGQSLVLLRLTAQKFLAQHAMRNEENEEVLVKPIAQILEQTREISRRLSPDHLQKLGLASAIEDMLLSAAQASGVRIRHSLDALENFFPDNWNIQLYRVLQEAITNALKYSAATLIDVQALRIENFLTVTVEDNGKGFGDVKPRSGIGLTLMRERVRGLGGRIFFESSERGVLISIVIGAQEIS